MDEIIDKNTICRQSDAIEVRRMDNRGRGGRGVFAIRPIAAGSLIECVPVLLIPKAQVFGDTPEARRNSRISWYVFAWDDITKRTYVALALGYGSIYNHSFTPNARYQPKAPDLLEFYAIEDISPGSEIFINYHGKTANPAALEFDVH